MESVHTPTCTVLLEVDVLVQAEPLHTLDLGHATFLDGDLGILFVPAALIELRGTVTQCSNHFAYQLITSVLVSRYKHLFIFMLFLSDIYYSIQWAQIL